MDGGVGGAATGCVDAACSVDRAHPWRVCLGIRLAWTPCRGLTEGMPPRP
ncbi:hypothetical protein ASZ90_002269 [hydrocarbon metagenome]|uniref:Uncharacterized protein n=1 Tax=hydrocarbon metagenome TaxID=938273 RepID=A0A0W8G420_9ZZZZ